MIILQRFINLCENKEEIKIYVQNKIGKICQFKYKCISLQSHINRKRENDIKFKNKFNIKNESKIKILIIYQKYYYQYVTDMLCVSPVLCFFYMFLCFCFVHYINVFFNLFFIRVLYICF